MALDSSLTDADPTPGVDGGISGEQQGTPAPQTPAARTYNDNDMANARRSFETQSKRERESALAAVRAEYEQRFAPKPQSNDPWSRLDPTVAEVLKGIFQHEMETRLTPFKEQQEDISFRNDEAEIRAKYPDYAKNRAAVLEFGAQNGIGNIEQAYRAWKYDELSQLDPDAIGKAAVASYTKKKTQQASTTPAVEGKGGGAPSSAQKIKTWDDADEAAASIFRSSQE